MKKVIVLAILALAANVMTAGTAHGNTVLLQDDFGGTSLETLKWGAHRANGSPAGSSVTVANGVVTVVQDQTDNGGVLFSQPLTFAPTGLITIIDRVYVHADNGEVYGGTSLGGGNWQFGVIHAYIASWPLNAFTFGDNGVAIGDASGGLGGYGGGNNFGQVGAIWDTWFNETITLDPQTSVVTYSINGGPAISGILSAPMPDQPLTLAYNSYGWFTGHYEKIDSVSVTQAPEPATLFLFTLGGLFLRKKK